MCTFAVSTPPCVDVCEQHSERSKRREEGRERIEQKQAVVHLCSGSEVYVTFPIIVSSVAVHSWFVWTAHVWVMCAHVIVCENAHVLARLCVIPGRSRSKGTRPEVRVLIESIV